MLYDIISGEKIDEMAHQREFNLWIQSISKTEFEKIINYINDAADAKGNVKLQEFIPVEKWSGTIFEPVYMKACFMDEKLSMMFLELILWFTIQNRPDKWYYKNIKTSNSLSAEKYYFRKEE